MTRPAVSDVREDSLPPLVAQWDTAGLNILALPEDGLPDPVAKWGRHVRWVLIYGQPLTHGEWACTHEGACPPGCTKLPDVPHANPYAASPAWDAWQAFMRGCHHWTIPTQPVPEPETGVTLRARGSWNQFACVSEPIEIQPLPGMKLAAQQAVYRGPR
jgi:hypothetical protein